MADVRPLRGVRFAPERSGPVGPLIAPPYDVAATPRSAIAHSIRHIEGVDLGNGADNHRIAARRYRDWLRTGVLRRDPEPAIYIHRHQFSQGDDVVSRTGILARVRLSDWAERIVMPHERTNPGPTAERLCRLRAVGANLSPLYFLYRDEDGSIRDLIATTQEGVEALVGADQMGGVHRLRPIFDPGWHGRLMEALDKRRLFVADGHHRYEAALTYRDERRAAGPVDPDAPSEFVLALIAAVEDPGVLVRPTHRVLVDGFGVTPETLLNEARAWFDIQPASGSEVAADDARISRLALPNGFGAWDLRAKPGSPHLELLPSDRGSAWRSLPVAGIEGLIGAMVASGALPAEARVVPVVDAEEAVGQVAGGRAQAAFLVPDPPLDRLLAVAEEGDLLPPKSTWFDPKAPAGLVINDLHD